MVKFCAKKHATIVSQQIQFAGYRWWFMFRIVSLDQWKKLLTFIAILFAAGENKITTPYLTYVRETVTYHLHSNTFFGARFQQLFQFRNLIVLFQRYILCQSIWFKEPCLESLNTLIWRSFSLQRYFSQHYATQNIFLRPVFD